MLWLLISVPFRGQYFHAQGKAVKPQPLIYQLKVTLIGIHPAIWWRFKVPASLRLCCLHSAIQVVMGWTDSHLDQFEKDGKNWGVPEWDEFDDST